MANNRRYLHKLLYLAAGAFAFVALTSCSTGIDNTKEVKMTSSELKVTLPSAEEKYLADIKGLPLSQWELGRRFLVADERAALVFGLGNYAEESLKGETLFFRGVESRRMPDGKDFAVVVFADDSGNHYRYLSDFPVADADRLLSDAIPMLIDMGMVEAVAERLKGKTYWTTSSLWYDEEDAVTEGRKFVPVKVVDVTPGTSVFPVYILFEDETGRRARMLMNLGDSGIGSRSFATLFSLDDPKNRYPRIEPETWKLIQQGRVRVGMTKEECRLSLGNPSDALAGHNFSQTLDYWKYPDGKYLHFQDGLLVDFR